MRKYVHSGATAFPTLKGAKFLVDHVVRLAVRLQTCDHVLAGELRAKNKRISYSSNFTNVISTCIGIAFGESAKLQAHQKKQLLSSLRTAA